MPGMITHFIFGHSVKNNLCPRYKRIINEHHGIFNIGAQGPDLFFYYLPGFFKSNTKEIGLILHKKNVGEFIKHLINEVKHYENEEREICIAYLLGYLTHYVLDYKTHPYIYYRTGFRNKNKPITSTKYSVIHKKFEESIDLTLMKVLSEKSDDIRPIWKVVDTGELEKEVVSEILIDGIKKVYNRDISKKEMINVITYLQRVTKYLDNGKKKRRFNSKKLKEDLKITEEVIKKIQGIEDKKDKDYFNLNRNKWHSPHDKNEEHTKSFMDMYEDAHSEVIDLINQIELYCVDKIEEEKIIKRVGNYSLASGLDCNEDKEFKYFNLKKL